MKKKIDKQTLTTQIISDNLLGNFIGYMPNPDDIISGTIESYDTYRKMKTDGRIKSLLNKIKNSALIFPSSFEQPDGCPINVYNFIKAIPLFSNIYKKEKRMLTALDYGFSVSEVIWDSQALENGKFIPENIITRKPDRFSFDSSWNLFWSQFGEKQELNQPYKWLIFQHDPDDENPYGTSVLRCVYWAWMFKQAGYEFWLQATEKYSVKSIIALFKGDGDENHLKERAQSIAEMLLGISSGSAAAVSNVDQIHELSMSGDLDAFNALVDACDVQISYGLTGQSIATSKTDGGSFALGEVQAEMLFEDCKGIALELQGVIQKLINWIVELNFGEGVIPPNFVFDVERKASFDQVMTAIEKGIPVSKKALYENYKLPEPKNTEDSFIKQTSGFELSDPFDGKKKVQKQRQHLTFSS